MGSDTPTSPPDAPTPANPIPMVPLVLPPLALPWYSVGGVPAFGDVAAQEVADEDGVEVADALHLLSIEDIGSNPRQHDLGEPIPPGSPSAVFTFGASTDEKHESSAHKRRARQKRALDRTRKLRHNTRLVEEHPDFEDPFDRASRF